ncbi:trypsin-like serine peptidase [Peribacillus sp. NPDC055009]
MKEMSLEDLYNTPAIPATQEMPAEMKEMLRPSWGVYVRSQYKPKMDFATENVPGVPGMWQVVGCSHDEELLTTIPGLEQEEIELKAEDTSAAKEDVSSTEGYRPPWQPLEYLPRLVPFRVGDRVFLEPRATEEGRRLGYPFNTVGLIKVNGIPRGTGVLVGPNLMLTASHVAPWGVKNWSMEFIPAFRQGDPQPPFGSSFVQTFRGIKHTTQTSGFGYDYVICKLYKPLGNAIGWMGTQWWGNEEEYYKRRYVSTGYPETFQNKPAVELDMGLRDIDNDSPGIELEFSLAGHPDIGHGWSGGPLWLPSEGPKVVGVLSGTEKDEFDPPFLVYAGGKHMVDLVKYGMDNWRP